MLCFICRSKIKDDRQKKDQSVAILNEQISVIFVLRKIMEIPSATCEKLLETHQNPSSWISYCPDCKSIVKDAHAVFKEFLLLERKFKTLKVQINNYIEVANAEILKTAKWKSASSAPNVADFILSKFLKNIPVPDILLTEGNFSDSFWSDVKLEHCDDNEADQADTSIDEPTLEESDEKNVFSGADKEVDDDIDINASYKCGWCDKSYKQKATLKVHENKVHIKDLTETCEICEEKFPTRIDYRHHFWKVHPNSKPTVKKSGVARRPPRVCHLCNKSFDRKQYYDLHMKRHKGFSSDVKLEYCDDDKVKQADTNIDKPISADSDEEKDFSGADNKEGDDDININIMYKCGLCDKSYKQKATLKVHENKVHIKDLTETCEICEEKFPTRIDYRRHFQKVHPNSKPTVKKSGFAKRPPRVCHLCNKSFDRKVYYDLHMKRHKGIAMDYCAEDSTVGYDLKQTEVSKSHPIIIDHKLEEKIIRDVDKEGYSFLIEMGIDTVFNCNLCDKSYKNKGTLKAHIKKMHSKVMTESCEICEERFSNRIDYRCHFRKFHPNDTPSVKKPGYPKQSPCMCELCGKTFTRRRILELHMMRHKGLRNYLCELCPQSFHLLRELKEHKRWLHHKELGLDPVKCQECGKILSSAASLERHVKIKHTRKFSIFCNICNAGFAASSNLKLHIQRWHTSVPPFKCPMCDKRFFHSRLRDTHVVNNHTKKFDYICTICSKGFATKPGLNRHMDVHSAEGRHRKKYAAMPKVPF